MVLFVIGGRFNSTARGDERPLAKAGNGTPIYDPISRMTVATQDGSKRIEVPAGMVFVSAGECQIGTGADQKTVNVPAFCIGRFDVTNVEYQQFIKATGTQPPRYWKGGSFPNGKANHPVAFVSLVDARAYADWVGKAAGRDVSICTADQWEKAARGPKGFLYPWGNDPGVQYANAVMTTRCNFNGVLAAQCLKDRAEELVVYDNPKSTRYKQKTTVAQIAAYDDNGGAQRLSVGPRGQVSGWVNHSTYTGFIYTDLFTEINDAGGNTNAVGAYANGVSGYGCFDMAGNVWDWCDSQITATNGAEQGKRVNEIRGGSWYATLRSCQSVSIGEGRDGRSAYNTVGFRIVSALPIEKQ